MCKNSLLLISQSVKEQGLGAAVLMLCLEGAAGFEFSFRNPAAALCTSCSTSSCLQVLFKDFLLGQIYLNPTEQGTPVTAFLCISLFFFKEKGKNVFLLILVACVYLRIAGILKIK